MLDPSVRKTVDQLWDLIWSSGITNPLAVVDYLTGLFVLSRGGGEAVREAAAAGDSSRCVALMTGAMESLGLSTPDPALWQDAALLHLTAGRSPGASPRESATATSWATASSTCCGG